MPLVAVANTDKERHTDAHPRPCMHGFPEPWHTQDAAAAAAAAG